MDLNTIQLLPRQIAELYENVLIDTPAQAASEGSSITYSGGNARNVLILINKPNEADLPQREMEFLMNVLSACKLSLDDIALINWIHYREKPFSELLAALSPKYILLFDIAPKDIGLPIHFPPFQVQSFDGRKYLAAPSLIVLEHDKPKKKELWSCLKTLFSL